VLHPVLGVVLALVCAEAARLGAGLQGTTHHLRLEGRLPRENLAGGLADIGTVEVEPDAADE
jgi:hypothetical protein